MVRIYVSDAEIDVILAEAVLPPEVREHISGKDAEHRAERVLAYLMLLYGYRECFGEDLPKLFWDELGKPHLLGEDGTTLPRSISISHSRGVAAVAIDISENICALGVDVEEHRELVSRERIERRLLTHALDVRTEKLPTEIFRARMAGGASGDAPFTFEKLAEERVAPERSDEESFFDKWTALEALLKAEGSGFAAVVRTNELAEKALFSTVRLSIGGKNMSLSVAALGSR